MSLLAVQTALEVRANAALAGWSIARENAPVTTPTNAKWARVVFLPNVPSVDTLGSAGQDMVDGVFQIDLNYPQWTGDAAAREDFEMVRALFAAGTKLTTGGQSVAIVNCGRSGGRRVENFWRISVSIYWYAMIPR